MARYRDEGRKTERWEEGRRGREKDREEGKRTEEKKEHGVGEKDICMARRTGRRGEDIEKERRTKWREREGLK